MPTPAHAPDSVDREFEAVRARCRSRLRAHDVLVEKELLVREDCV